MNDHQWASQAVKEMLRRCVASLVFQLESEAKALRKWGR